MNKQNNTAPTSRNYSLISKPLRSKFMAFGVPGWRLLGVVLVCIGGFLLAMLLGLWQHETMVPYSSVEQQQVNLEYKNIVNQLVSMEKQRELDGYSSILDMNLTSTQQEIYTFALEHGITPSITQQELEKIVPTKHTVVQPVIGLAPRLIVLVLIPFLVGFSLFYEGKDRVSLYKEASRSRRFSKSQKNYRYAPLEYIRRETGKDYFSVVSTIK